MLSSVPRPIREYLHSNIPKAIREPSCCKLDVPYPYTVPGGEGGFYSFFYWDTYFSNWALYALGMDGQAKNNLLDMAALIAQFGYMPNADVLTDRSQPPLFIRGVAEYFGRTGDRAFLAQALPAAEKEYCFWMTRRMAPCGLNRYGGEADGRSLRDFNNMAADRLGMPRLPAGGAGDLNFLACAESGWDFSSRFFRGAERCVAAEVCPIDLNAILYGAELDLARFCREFSREEDARGYEANASRRKELLLRYCYDEESGLYFDYDAAEGTRSGKATAAGFFPAAFGLGGTKEGIKSLLSRLLTDHGLAACERSEYSERFQWDWPTMWSPLVGICTEGLSALGAAEEAGLVARRYCDTVERVFSETGHLWEKYDVARCGVGSSAEYDTPPMLGWTAGVYLKCKELLKSEQNNIGQPKQEE